MSRSIELLAPAKDLACGIEAIRHGADAVYIGAERFGARAAAGNSVADIGELCRFAHQYAAKIYVTVNTILYDNELSATRDLVWALYDIGVDALIVQDLALLKMSSSSSSLILPPIPLHASTQMDNRTAAKAQWLGRLGFDQLVLARELSLEQIHSIHNALQAQAQVTNQPAPLLEAFVHGALCVSYSGRCYASQHCFGRSAHRGECAQFCRLAFDLLDAEGNVIEHDRHLLSLRDMNRSEHLEAMIDAGVSSFKIEGRLKDVSYVKNITAYYRQRLDAIINRRTDLRRASLGQCTYTFKPDPAKSFNRGFTDYFLFGRTGREANFVTPKAMGENIGRVVEVRPNAIVVGTTASLANGDGFCFVDATGHLQGFRTNRAEGDRIKATVPGLEKGMALYRNQDAAFERLLARPSADRRIPVRWLLADIPDGFTLTLSVEAVNQHLSSPVSPSPGISPASTVPGGSPASPTPGISPASTGPGGFAAGMPLSIEQHSVSLTFAYPHEAARTPQADNIRKQLSRLGDSPFEAAGVEVQMADNWFIPSSVLADWRRHTVAALIARLAPRRAEHPIHPTPDALRFDDWQDARLDYTANVSNHLALEAYKEAGAADVAPAYELQAPPHATIMTCRHCIRYAIGLCPRQDKPSAAPVLSPSNVPVLSPSNAPCSNNRPVGQNSRGDLSLRLPDGRRFPLRFNCQECEMLVESPYKMSC